MVRTAVLCVVLLFVVFYVAGFLTGKSEGGGLFKSIANYTGASIIALDSWLISGTDVTYAMYWGQDLFIGVFTIIYILNPSITRTSVHFKMTNWENGGTNIYTSIMLYYKYFGVIGVLLIYFLLGYIFRHIFDKTKRNKNATSIVVFSAFFYVVPYIPIAERVFSTVFTPTTMIMIATLFIIIRTCTKHGRNEQCNEESLN